MDFNNINWIGNVYQKFETMCLEVEEIIVQDTAKYMGNQMQTVGASMKKFYSDVVQDLVPPSSEDSLKGDADSHLGFEEDDLKSGVKRWNNGSKVMVDPKSAKDSTMGSSELYVPKPKSTGIYRKPKLGIKRIPRKESPSPTSNGICQDLSKEPRLRSLCDKDRENAITSNTVLVDVPVSNFLKSAGDSIPNVSAETSRPVVADLVTSKKSENTESLSSAVPVETNETVNRQFVSTSIPVAANATENRALASATIPVETNETENRQFVSTARPVAANAAENRALVSTTIPLETNEIENRQFVSTARPVAANAAENRALVSTTIPVETTETENRQFVSTAIPVAANATENRALDSTTSPVEINESDNRAFVSTTTIPAEANESGNRELVSTTTPIEADDVCMIDDVGSRTGSFVDVDKPADKAVSVSSPGRSNEWSNNMVEKIGDLEEEGQSMEASKRQVEESCILVSGDEAPYVVSYKESKRRPYKKKIRDAISSRLKSGRKLEYELLAVQWSEEEFHDRSQACDNSDESDWELL